jgi:hypothetical protein
MWAFAAAADENGTGAKPIEQKHAERAKADQEAAQEAERIVSVRHRLTTNAYK